MMNDKTKNKLKKTIFDKPRTLFEISSLLDMPKTELKKIINQVQKEGVYVSTKKTDKGTTYYIPSKLPRVEPPKVQTDYFALTSDWHIGNKYVEEECLLNYLDILREYGIKNIFHGGDLYDGVGVYQGQVNDLLPDCLTLQGQIEYLNKLLPEQKNHTIYTISGNHDLKNFKKQGIDPVKFVCDNRKDFKYLGQYYGRVRLKDGIVLEITHPTGSVPYSKDYKIMTYLRDRPINTYPDVLGLGHLHTALFRDYQGTQSYMLGTFLGDTDYTRRRGLSPSVGGWIVELEIDGEIKKVKNEWIKY